MAQEFIIGIKAYTAVRKGILESGSWTTHASPTSQADETAPLDVEEDIKGGGVEK
jgi:hypothetical protein